MAKVGRKLDESTALIAGGEADTPALAICRMALLATKG